MGWISPEVIAASPVGFRRTGQVGKEIRFSTTGRPAKTPIEFRDESVTQMWAHMSLPLPFVGVCGAPVWGAGDALDACERRDCWDSTTALMAWRWMGT